MNINYERFKKDLREDFKLLYTEEDFEQWFEELNDYAPEILISFLKGIGFDVNMSDTIVDGTYTSVWEDEGEITANAKINLRTKEVNILESFDPSECTTEDGEPFECNILEKEYVMINGEEYPCCNEEDLKFTENENCFWYR